MTRGGPQNTGRVSAKESPGGGHVYQVWGGRGHIQRPRKKLSQACSLLCVTVRACKRRELHLYTALQ